MPDWLVYNNAGATRNQPLSPQLVNALGFLNDLGVQMNVFSGGQAATGPNRVGSHRHDFGNAADVLFSQGGRQLDWANPDDRALFQQIVQKAKAAGVTGFGAGPGYMQRGSMHIGFGAPGVWGAGGKGATAPDWLRAAYGGTEGPSASAMNVLMTGKGAGPQGTFQPALGDLVPPTAVQTTAVPPADPGALAFNFIQNAQERKKAEAEAQRVEQERRAALFAPPRNAVRRSTRLSAASASAGGTRGAQCMEPVRMIFSVRHLQQAAVNVAARAEIEADRLRRHERAMIEDAMHEHASMPANYWQPRWKAEQRLLAARALEEALREIEP